MLKILKVTLSVLLLLYGALELLHDAYHLAHDPSLLGLPNTKYVLLESAVTFILGAWLTKRYAFPKKRH